MATGHTNSGIRSGFKFFGFILIVVINLLLLEWMILLPSVGRRWLDLQMTRHVQFLLQEWDKQFILFLHRFLLVLKIFTSFPAVRAEFPNICFTDIFRTVYWHLLAIRLFDLIRLHIPEMWEQTILNWVNAVNEAASGNTGILQFVSLTSSFINNVFEHLVLHSTTRIYQY